METDRCDELKIGENVSWLPWLLPFSGCMALLRSMSVTRSIPR